MPEKEEFLPFHAINEFMRDDYRLTVLTEVLGASDRLTPEKRSAIGKMITRYVSVPGFRNGNLAPVGKKARASASLFERSSEFVALVVESWSHLHPELATTMFEVLSEHAWENLQPLEVDRSQLPGFSIHWPKQDNFAGLIKAAHEKNPALAGESEDNISLMAVWIGDRLPYDLFVEEGQETTEKEN